jgi:tetratricopeptide (TPR) repeat protein
MKFAPYFIRDALFLTLLCSSPLLYGQTKVNYSKNRHNYALTICGSSSVELIEKRIHNLESLEPKLISRGKYTYYYDLGMSYYSIAIIHNRPEDFDRAIRCFTNCTILKKKTGAPYYNLAIIYDFQNKHSLAYECLQKYKIYEKRKNWDFDEITLFEQSLKLKLDSNKNKP